MLQLSYPGGLNLLQTYSKLLLIAALAVLSLCQSALAQNPSAALASLPEADALIYISPQRILNEAAPRVMAPAEVTKMRASFAEIKTAAGVSRDRSPLQQACE